MQVKLTYADSGERVYVMPHAILWFGEAKGGTLVQLRGQGFVVRETVPEVQAGIEAALRNFTIMTGKIARDVAHNNL